MNRQSPIIQLGTGLANIDPDVGGICLMISREEVINPRVGRSVDDLMHLSTCPDRTRRFAHTVLLAMDGWNDDPREIHRIPECRAYLTALTAQWPYWMHFLAPIPDLWGVLLMAQMPPTKRVQLSPGQFAVEYDRTALRQLLSNLVNAMNDLHQHHGLDVKTRQQIFEVTMQAIEKCTTEHPGHDSEPGLKP